MATLEWVKDVMLQTHNNPDPEWHLLDAECHMGCQGCIIQQGEWYITYYEDDPEGCYGSLEVAQEHLEYVAREEAQKRGITIRLPDRVQTG